MKGSWSPAGVREALWKLEKFQGPGSRREGVLFKSASLRGRRSERQAGEVTPKAALTDEFTCGQEKGAFQEEKQWMPKVWTEAESKSSRFLDLEGVHLLGRS